eukprot:2906275-Pyramimonas_sp.AAC.4
MGELDELRLVGGVPRVEHIVAFHPVAAVRQLWLREGGHKEHQGGVSLGLRRCSHTVTPSHRHTVTQYPSKSRTDPLYTPPNAYLAGAALAPGEVVEHLEQPLDEVEGPFLGVGVPRHGHQKRTERPHKAQQLGLCFRAHLAKNNKYTNKRPIL